MGQGIIFDSGCQAQELVWLDGTYRLHTEERKRKYYAFELAYIYDLSSRLRPFAWKLRVCGDQLVFGRTEKGERRLLAANYCLERLCPQCMHRRTVRVFAQMTHVLDWLDKLCDDAGGQAHYRYVLLTLTIKNCPGPELKATIDHLMHSWSKLRRKKPFVKSIKGYFRVLEVTLSEKEGMYHPHFHVMLAVRPSYFKDGYISQKRWVQMWQEAAQLDYEPVVDVRAIKDVDGGRGGVAEVTKYTVKGSDYIYPDHEKAVPVVETLRDSLFGRRLYFFGGVFADARKALRLGDAENDLTDAEDVEIRRECIVAIERFHWVHDVGDWVMTSTGGPPPTDVRDFWREENEGKEEKRKRDLADVKKKAKEGLKHDYT